MDGVHQCDAYGLESSASNELMQRIYNAWALREIFTVL